MRAGSIVRGGFRTGVALVLAILVLLGLASGGVAPPQQALAQPLVPHDLGQAGAQGRASSDPAAHAPVRQAVVAATSVAVRAPPLAPIPTRCAPEHQDADLRRARLRLPIEIRGPPARRFA